MIYIGISAQTKSIPHVSGHNFGSDNIHAEYDSSFQRGKLALKHTKKANKICLTTQIKAKTM